MDYQVLAAYYDTLINAVDYPAWVDFYETAFERYLIRKPKIILDLGCGSGRMTRELARRGYRMIGVDKSAEMLARADENATQAGQKILFLRQDMRSLDLFDMVDAVVCSLDCINYLLRRNDIINALYSISTFLEDGGLFIFDVNTVYKFETEFADRSYVFDTDKVFCTWENQYNEKTKLCRFYLTFFVPDQNDNYQRLDERQTERAWSDRTLIRVLEESGFEVLDVVSDLAFTKATDHDIRHYFICRKLEEE